jgi:hypothetical protein
MVAEHFTLHPRCTIAKHAVLVGNIIVIIHYAMTFKMIAGKEVIFFPAHAVAHKVLIHFGLNALPIIQMGCKHKLPIHITKLSKFMPLNRATVIGINRAWT